MLDPQAHFEALELIRVATVQDDAEFAQITEAMVNEFCYQGHADRAAIWADLTPSEQAQYKELLQ
jgi:hypothetical protein